jgi:hypothetical protein
VAAVRSIRIQVEQLLVVLVHQGKDLLVVMALILQIVVLVVQAVVVLVQLVLMELMVQAAQVVQVYQPQYQEAHQLMLAVVVADLKVLRQQVELVVVVRVVLAQVAVAQEQQTLAVAVVVDITTQVATLVVAAQESSFSAGHK